MTRIQLNQQMSEVDNNIREIKQLVYFYISLQNKIALCTIILRSLVAKTVSANCFDFAFYGFGANSPKKLVENTAFISKIMRIFSKATHNKTIFVIYFDMHMRNLRKPKLLFRRVTWTLVFEGRNSNLRLKDEHREWKAITTKPFQKMLSESWTSLLKQLSCLSRCSSTEFSNRLMIEFGNLSGEFLHESREIAALLEASTKRSRMTRNLLRCRWGSHWKITIFVVCFPQSPCVRARSLLQV